MASCSQASCPLRTPTRTALLKASPLGLGNLQSRNHTLDPLANVRHAKAPQEAFQGPQNLDAYETGMQFDELRHAMAIHEWQDLQVDEVLSRGRTPLLIALMRIITKAEEVNKEKTAIVVMTDGYKNASREVGKEDARAACQCQ